MYQDKCFADRGGKCGALTQMLCHTQPCPFFKTADQLAMEQSAGKRRLQERSLKVVTRDSGQGYATVGVIQHKAPP